MPSLHLCCGALTVLPFVIPTGEVMGLGPPKVMKSSFCSATTLPGSTALPFVISTEAYPDFLLRAAGYATCAVLLKESRMQIINATDLDRKSGGAQWRDLCVDALSWECFSTEESWAFGPPKVMKNGSYSATTLPGSTALPFVISTEAYPDFLLRAAGNDHVCGSP